MVTFGLYVQFLLLPALFGHSGVSQRCALCHRCAVLPLFGLQELQEEMEPSQQSVAESIPIWDGNPRGWRRYQREVLWYCMGQKKHARKLLAPRLIAKLTGPARLLAMSWNQADFTGEQRVAVAFCFTIGAEEPAQYPGDHESVLQLQAVAWREHCKLLGSGVALLRGVHGVFGGVTR